MNQEKTGALIAACRRAQGLTQAQLAERLHIKIGRASCRERV